MFLAVLSLIFMFVITIWAAINPRSQYRVVNRLNYANPEAHEPSDLAVGISRVAGIVMTGLLIFAVVSYISDQRQAEEEARRRAEIAATPIPQIEDFALPEDPNLNVPMRVMVELSDDVRATVEADESIALRQTYIDRWYYPYVAENNDFAVGNATVTLSDDVMSDGAPMSFDQATLSEYTDAPAGVVVALMSSACFVYDTMVETTDRGQVEITVIADGDGEGCKNPWVFVPLTQEEYDAVMNYEAPEVFYGERPNTDSDAINYRLYTQGAIIGNVSVASRRYSDNKESRWQVIYGRPTVVRPRVN